MACKTTCPYFPNPMNSVDYKLDNLGVRHCSHKFICGFNSAEIVSWNMDCPRDLNKNKEETNDKRSRKQKKVR